MTIENEVEVLPILPLRENYIYPGVVMPVIVGSSESLAAIEEAVEHHQGNIICLMQRNLSQKSYPTEKELYPYGFVCRVTQLIKMPDKKIRVLLRGQTKVFVDDIYNDSNHLKGCGLIIREQIKNQIEAEVLTEKLKNEFTMYFSMSRLGKSEHLDRFHQLVDPFEVLYFICMTLDIANIVKQSIIAEDNFTKKAKKLLKKIGEKLEYLDLQRSIDNEVFGKINKMQREHFLSEQIKAIHRELGVSSDPQSEAIELREKFDKLNISSEARKKVDEELRKLTRIPSHSPEYFVVYNYLTSVAELPWDAPKMEHIDINTAEAILEADHYGLEKIKDRILEYLAVMQFNTSSRAQILCFVGPPGVGKTSLGKSIARAMGREFVRLSVGGVTDEAEIRGHRKTYIGAMPGIIMQSLKKTGTINTLIMIDEIDKLCSDFRGDPSSALLEVLDPEQNFAFRDHYFEFGYDLSNVFFITTANTMQTIPAPLADRMEVINLSSYTLHEKVHIANKFLIPKKIKEFNIEKRLKINISDKIINSIITDYTSEAGVRELERNINAIFRKSIKKFLKKEIKKTITIDLNILRDFLGVERTTAMEIPEKSLVGVAYGLAWTSVGGDIIPVEVTKFPGDGKFQITGNIGKVMDESFKAALSLVQSNQKKWGIKPDILKKFDFHVHIPEGAVPKDGPSAGLVLTVALVSALNGKPVDRSYTMTGEITLTGRILPIGGLTEKIVAAQRYGFKNVILPIANKQKLTEVKPEAKEGLNFIFVDNVDSVIACLGFSVK
jgi:ATP-dependent Lon protease